MSVSSSMVNTLQLRDIGREWGVRLVEVRLGAGTTSGDDSTRKSVGDSNGPEMGDKGGAGVD